MSTVINPTLVEDIQSAIETVSKINKWQPFGTDDQTKEFREMFQKEEPYVKFNGVSHIVYSIDLGHQLYATLMDEHFEITLNNEDPAEAWKKDSSEDDFSNRTLNLYICDRPLTEKEGSLELGVRLLQISWNRLFRNTPFGISEIKMSVKYNALEDKARLPMILKIIEEVSNVPVLKDLV